jgi:uncharacterized protein (TIGR03084 family)
VADARLIAGLLDDLDAESADLDALVSDLPEDGWSTPTPAQGWDVRDTITHLHQTDVDALFAVTDPSGFQRFLAGVKAAQDDPEAPGHVEGTVAAGRSTSPSDLLAAWRTDRTRLVRAVRGLEAGARVPWFGPPMSVPSFITARVMETWAHGQDIADALGRRRPATSRLRHVAEIGVRARPFSYAVNGIALPAEQVRVELAAPDGERGSWGQRDAVDVVQGPALDFCLLVTQRRHRDDLRLDIRGQRANEWMSIAQAFAGPPGAGRAPLGAPATWIS